MEVARRAAAPHVGNPAVAAVMVAGSVGRGVADQYSDLEIDVYWHTPPTDVDRRAPIDALGAELTHFWAYSEVDEEWAEEYFVDRLGIGLSHFLVSTVDRWLVDVVERADTADDKQMRIAAIRDGIALRGDDVLERWRAASEPYPEALAAAMVRRHLDPDVIDGWHMRHALVDRGDTLKLHAWFVRLTTAVFGSLLGLNRIYLASSSFKWQRTLLASLPIAPPDLDQRLAAVFRATPGEAVAALEAILAETVDLVARRIPDLDLAPVHSALARLRPHLPPPA
jgi:hypothetical protein